MEYSVGSLADLISGKNTPNKPKLISKAFSTTKKIVVDSPNENSPQTIDGKKPKLEKKSVKNTKDKLFTGKQNDDAFVKARKFKTLDRKRKQKKNESPKNNMFTEVNDVKELNRKRKLSEPVTDSAESTSSSLPLKKQRLGLNETNAANRIKSKFNKEIKNSTDYKDRTLFVGNIPINTSKEKIKRHFKKYGLIDSVRIRGIPVANIKTPKKIAAIKKEFHPDRMSVYAFIRFVNAEDAKKAAVENGQIFFNHHIRVHFCEEENIYDEAKAIFVGNLPFKAEEEELWNIFKSCGAISHVRIVRDGRTGMGKGFAYVNFQETDSVQLALEMGKVTFKDRELRISLCETNRSKKKKLGKKPRHTKIHPKSENPDETTDKQKLKIKTEKIAFSGSKFTDKKKKKKFNKGLAEKKTLAKKLVAPGLEKTTAA